jgi:CRP-like cAMP-binding protein
MSSIDQIITILKSEDLFNGCHDDFIGQMAAQGRIISVNKGQVLFVSHDEAAYFYIVVSGWVKLFRETLDGAQAVVDILPAGHMFGETSLFENGAYPYSAEATESMKLLAVPMGLLQKEIENNPRMALAMLSAMARYRKHQDREIEHRTLQNAPQRIGCFLLRLADQNHEGAVKIHLPYDKTLLASRLGMQPETFSRALAKLKEKTGIKVNGATIEMDSLDQLVKYSCAACSSEFPCNDLPTCSKAE